MFESFMDGNHQMNIPENDIFMQGIKIVQYPLINDEKTNQDHWNERINKGTKAPVKIDQLVIHCSFEPDIENVLDKNNMGAHYVVHKDGTVLQCVDESKRTYHAGISSWAQVKGGDDNINAHSIGIEVENPTFGSTTEYTPEQMDSLIRLCKSIIARHHIKPHNVIGHSDIAPGRKADPGVLFPWRKLADNGIGIFPKYTQLPDTNDKLSDSSVETKVREALESIGYKTKIETRKKEGYTEIVEIRDNLPMAWLSFMRHYMPFGISGERPIPEQVKVRKEKYPEKSTAEILSDLSLDFMKEFEKNTHSDPKKQVTRVSSLGIKRLQSVVQAFQQSRLKNR